MGKISYLFLFHIKSFLFFIACVFTPLSLAKIHIEPYAGYSFTSTNSRPFQEEDLSTTTKTLTYLREGRFYSGITSGMRIGYTSLGLAVGIDLTIGRWSSLYKEGFAPFFNKETITPYLPGLFVSYKLPLLFRAYATLIPHTLVQFDSTEFGEEEAEGPRSCKKSRGLKLGVSYISLPFISVNFEYMPLYINGAKCDTWSHTGTVFLNFIF